LNLESEHFASSGRRSPIERRQLEKFRLLETDYLITLDGTGHLALGDRPSRFTEGCPTQALSNGGTLYYRPVLEAKLVTRSGLALSIDTEFLENIPRQGRSDEQYKHAAALALRPVSGPPGPWTLHVWQCLR